MIKTIIFDLSEVLISGLIGIENPLAERLGIPESHIIAAFTNPFLWALCRGEMSEDAYLAQTIGQQGWNVSAEELKDLIRKNLHRRVAGMEVILTGLQSRYELVLLSDHSAEWIEYIQSIHPFLADFRHRFFSFQLGRTKQEQSTFRTVLAAIGREPEECLFIDDNPQNVSVACTVGIPGIVFTSAEALTQELAARGIS
jgi:HAD superfamily hydrolase (TIGR01509 family)